MEYMHPQPLRSGDTIAVVSPSWGGPSQFSQVFDRGLTVLHEEFGLRIKEYPTARGDAELLHRNPRKRAEDINQAFADAEVKAIIASIGGDDSVRILPFIDPDAVRNNPKILMGFSDTTTLLTYLNQLGLVTFHGPSIMAGLAQLDNMPAAYKEHIWRLLFDAPSTYEYVPYEVWSEGYPDWGDPLTIGQVNPQHSNDGWHWLQGHGVTQGELFGGNIEVLEFMKGTSFWPGPEFWQGKMLFFETSEEVPTPSQVKYMLRNYGMQGVYDRIRGVLFGRAYGYSIEQKRDLEGAVVSVVAVEFGRQDLPIISNMDFGHTDPQFILPLGVPAEIDCEHGTFRLVESACRRV